MNLTSGRLWLALAGLAGLLAQPQPAHAHPMGNFSISHLSRLTVGRDSLDGRYLLDFAEIPTVGEKNLADTNGDGQFNAREQKLYLQKRAVTLPQGIHLSANGRALPLQIVRQGLQLRPGAGGLQTLRLSLQWRAALPPGDGLTMRYEDTNFDERAGWKAVVVAAAPGVGLRNSTAPAVDRSRDLSVYATDGTAPQQTGATFRVERNAAASPPQPTLQDTKAIAANTPNANTPQDAFTRAIAERELTPRLMLLGVLLAFVFGALHSLSPGHGKAMVAAYLVGQRGTLRHAALLGLVVTVTHTLGVFALGLVTLWASRYIVPERLYPMLSAFSGLMVFGVGIWLLSQRTARLRQPHAHHHHDHDHSHDHAHDHDHDHGHDHDHDHDHDHSHDHHHGPGGHHHMIEGPITPRALVALGVSGGLVPCPSALVVLLSAVALHRVAYGLVLILAFSVGLASVLIALGMLVVLARGRMERFESRSGKTMMLRNWLTGYLPIGSALAITLIGLLLTCRALGPMAP